MDTVEKVVKYVLAIKEMVQMVHRNKKVCRETAGRVEIVGALMLRLQKSEELMQDPVTGNAVRALERTLHRVKILIKSCQKGTLTCHFFRARKVAKQLHEANNEIMHHVMFSNFAMLVFIVSKPIPDGAHPSCHRPCQRLQDAGMVVSSLTPHSNNNDARIEVATEIRRVQTATKIITVTEISPSPISDDQVLGQQRYVGFSRFKLCQLADATNNFSAEYQIGQGDLAIIYKGHLHGLEVAIKRFGSSDLLSCEIFSRELDLVAKLDHTNIIRHLGYCDEEMNTIVVYEYAANGSLDTFINRKGVNFQKETDRGLGSWLNWFSRMQIIEGIAQGVAYLHKSGAVHGDLKPSNILLDSSMNPKITGIGIDVISEKSPNSIAICYIAPEYIFPYYDFNERGSMLPGLLSQMSDVYSFGMIVLEIITGKSFSQHGQYKRLLTWVWELWEARNLNELIDRTLYHVSESDLDIQRHMRRCIWIAMLCIQENPADRPTMHEVLEMLTSKQLRLQAPKRPGYTKPPAETSAHQSLGELLHRHSRPGFGQLYEKCQVLFRQMSREISEAVEILKDGRNHRG